MGGKSSKPKNVQPKNCVPGECLEKKMFGKLKCANCYQPNAENYDYGGGEGGDGYPSGSVNSTNRLYYGLSIFFVIVIVAIWVIYKRKKE